MAAAKKRDWSLVSSHGSVLFFVACHSGCDIGEIAEGLGVTTRTAWSIVGDLRRAGMLQVTRSGRRNRFRVDPDGPFLHPTIRGVPLRAVLGALMRQGGRPADPSAAAVPVAR